MKIIGFISEEEHMNFTKKEPNIRDLVSRVETTHQTRPEDYAPKALRAVESALVNTEPLPMPNSSDVVVKSFLEMAEMIAKSMEAMGDRCEEQGLARKKEWYNAAQVARKKGEFQAREAGEYIDDLGKLKAISEKQKELKPLPANGGGSEIEKRNEHEAND